MPLKYDKIFSFIHYLLCLWQRLRLDVFLWARGFSFVKRNGSKNSYQISFDVISVNPSFVWERKRERRWEVTRSLSTRTALASALARDSLTHNSLSRPSWQVSGWLVFCIYNISMVITHFGNSALSLTSFSDSWVTSIRRCFCSKFNNFETNFAATRFIPKTFKKMSWHEPIDMPTLCYTLFHVLRKIWYKFFDPFLLTNENHGAHKNTSTFGPTVFQLVYPIMEVTFCKACKILLYDGYNLFVWWKIPPTKEFLEAWEQPEVRGS